MDPTQGPGLRKFLDRLAAVLDETSPDGRLRSPSPTISLKPSAHQQRGPMAPSALSRAAAAPAPDREPLSGDIEN